MYSTTWVYIHQHQATFLKINIYLALFITVLYRIQTKKTLIARRSGHFLYALRQLRLSMVAFDVRQCGDPDSFSPLPRQARQPSWTNDPYPCTQFISNIMSKELLYSAGLLGHEIPLPGKRRRPPCLDVNQSFC